MKSSACLIIVLFSLLTHVDAQAQTNNVYDPLFWGLCCHGDLTECEECPTFQDELFGKVEYLWVGTAPFCAAKKEDCRTYHPLRSDRCGNGSCCSSGTKWLCVRKPSGWPVGEAKIRIHSATYGGNAGAPKDNALVLLAAHCQGAVQGCVYRIDHKIIGDPARGKPKDFDAIWSCTRGTLSDGSVRRQTIAAEASGKDIELACDNSAPRAAALISVRVGIYGVNTTRPGNRTPHLAFSCNGKTICAYKVETRLLGDPAPNQAKNYLAQYTCGAAQEYRRALRHEADGQTIRLSCLSEDIVGVIRILDGTYGANVGRPVGNATLDLVAICTGKKTCTYKVETRVLGDPAPNQQKNYVARYGCGDGQLRTKSLVAEADGKSVELSCM